MRRSKGIVMVLIVSILLELGSKGTKFLSNTSTLVGMLLYLYFLYTEVPIILDRRFRTTIFKHDHVLRIGIAATPFVIFLLFAFSYPTFFMPSVFSTTPMYLDPTSFSSLAIGYIISMSLVYSWRLQSKHLHVAENFFRQVEVESESRLDVQRVKSRGLKGSYTVWTIGLMFSLLALVLSFFWIVAWMVDYVYLAFLGGWLIYEIAPGRVSRKSKLRSTLVKADETKKQTFFWEAFVLGATCGIQGISALLVMVFSMISCCGFLVLSLRGYPQLVLSWALFFGWYLLLLNIQIARRLNLKLRSLLNNEQKKVTTRQIPAENLAILAVSLFFVSVWSTNTHINIVQIQNFIRPSFSLVIFCFASVISAYSAIEFVKGRRLREDKPTKRGYAIDKAKLAWLWITGDLLFGSAFSNAIMVFLAIAGTVILFSFSTDLKTVFAETVPWKYAVINTLVLFLVGMGLLSVLHTVSYSEDFSQSFEPMVRPLFLIWLLLCIWSVFAQYHSQRDRLRARAKQDVGGTS